ncbi:hypothetical protein BDW68DRAFT_199015 [Aspergillus falconensis]
MRFTNISVSMIAVWALQLGNTVAEDRGAWSVEISTDDLCNDTTGWYADDAAIECISFDGLPEIKSIKAEGNTIGARCGFTIYAYENYGCTGESWYLQNSICLRAGFGDVDPLKSFKVYENPCV